MKSPALILAAAVSALCLPMRSLALDWLHDSREVPLRPSLITAEHEGKSYTVIAASKEFAEIEVDGKLRRLYADQSYQTPRAVGFAPGYIQFNSQNASSQIRTVSYYMMHGEAGRTETPGGVTSKHGDYACTLVASEAHPDCYIAVVFYKKGADGQPDPATSAIAFSQIGDLAAGRETQVKIRSAYIAGKGGAYYFFPLIFSRGQEIRSDQSEVSAAYFRIQEMTAHAAMLERYRTKFPTQDHPVVPYLRFQPELPVGFDPRTLPPTIDVTFAVTESGEVSAVEFKQELGSAVSASIRRALEGWLFLPRLKGGYPVRTMLSVPLSFAQASR